MKYKIIFICLLLLCLFGCENVVETYYVDTTKMEQEFTCVDGYLFINVEIDNGLVVPYQVLIRAEPTQKVITSKDGYFVASVQCKRKEKKNEN